MQFRVECEFCERNFASDFRVGINQQEEVKHVGLLGVCAPYIFFSLQNIDKEQIGSIITYFSSLICSPIKESGPIWLNIP
jgi:hypothetical protein